MVSYVAQVKIRNYTDNEQGLEKLPGKGYILVICPDSQAEKKSPVKSEIAKHRHVMWDSQAQKSQTLNSPWSQSSPEKEKQMCVNKGTYKELAHIVMEAEKFQDLQLESWKPRRANGIVPIQNPIGFRL